MTATLSRISSVLRARMFGAEPADAVLPLPAILEEEYAALHPDEPAFDTASHATFSADDIADLTGFARSLLYASPANPSSALGADVLRGQPELADLLRTTLVRGSAPPTNEARTRDLLARRLNALIADGTTHDTIETTFAAFIRTTDERRLKQVVERIHASRHAALCLSGGGIRSASFAMGVVQGLARRGLLSRFHYLSTVSGGGYTGSWLSAWMARDGANRVHEQLAGARTGKPDTEPAPLRHIRTFSYYLTPRFGLLSADTWTLIATIARNILLIWLVTLPVIAAALMLPRLFVAGPMTTLQQWNSYGLDPANVIVVLGTVGTLLAIIAISFVQRHLYTYSGRDDGEPVAREPATLPQFLTWCFAPLIIAMVALAQTWEMVWSLIRFSPEEAAKLAVPLSHHDWTRALIALDPRGIDAEGAAMLAGIGFWTFVYLTAWLFSVRGPNRRMRVYSGVLSALCGAIAGAIGGLGSAALFGLTEWRHPPEFYATFAVPLSLAGLLVSMHLVVGLASRRMSDAERESNARFSAWLLIGIVSWIAVVGLALYGPYALVGATLQLRHLIGIGGVSGVLGSLVAASSRSTGPQAGSAGKKPGFMAQAQQAAVAIATPLFAATLVVIVALLNTKLLRTICDGHATWCPVGAAGGRTDLFAGRLSQIAQTDYASPGLVFLTMLGLLAVGYLLGRLIDTNRFSLHAMYRERLVRTFLGASKPPGERQANPFTGFDETDDLPVGELWPTPPGPGDVAQPAAAHPPLHVVNVTLNTVAGTDLATQNRKATSFTVTSLHAGCAAVGYRRTSGDARLYGGKSGISLGTAMAISGAAASPNMGYHSSPAVTFLMTMFNARLGWWLGNPGHAGTKTYDDDEPRLALVPILDEMFGRTTDRSPYVYLSDGGHFENLGLYEMVRRRCRFIVVSDAGCDPACAFDDLGGAIRKIRIDFGIPIEFESGIPIYSRNATNIPGDARYWAVARVLYSQADGGGAGADGILLYVKPAFYRREPYDVYNYGESTPDFPHESTGNQFFGEAQFESYRALGEFAVDQMCQSEFGAPADSSDQITRAAFDEWFRSRTEAPLLSDARTPLSSRT